MKYFSLIILIVLVSFSHAQANTACLNNPDLNPIQDNNLAEAIKEELDVTELNCENLLELSQLNASNKNITTLEGLQYAINLTRLTLSKNQITDLDPLSELSELNRLILDNNLIQDLELRNLGNLASLEDLRLERNNLTNGLSILALTPLAKNLKTLHVGYNQIESLASLILFSNLRELSISGNPLAPSELERLRQVPTLTSARLASLNLSESSFIVSLFADPKELTRLRLDDNGSLDISPLTSFESLVDLSLSNNLIENQHLIASFRSIKVLSLASTDFTQLDALINLPSLRSLSLNNNYLKDISVLEASTGLQADARLLLLNNCVDEDNSSVQFFQERGVDIRVKVNVDKCQ